MDPEGSRRERAPRRGREGIAAAAQGQGVNCLFRKQAQTQYTPWARTSVPPVKATPVTQPASAACTNMRGGRFTHRRSSTEHGYEPVLASSISSPLTPSSLFLPLAGPAWSIWSIWPILAHLGPSGPYWSWRYICSPALHSSGLARSTDFCCISGDAEWKTAHLLVPLASQLLHLFLFLTHGDPLAFLALPEQASLFRF